MRSVRRLEGARLLVGDQELLDFASNDYLGLAADPRLASAMTAVVASPATGAGAARLITGSSPLHDLLPSVAAVRSADVEVGSR